MLSLTSVAALLLPSQVATPAEPPAGYAPMVLIDPPANPGGQPAAIAKSRR